MKRTLILILSALFASLVAYAIASDREFVFPAWALVVGMAVVAIHFAFQLKRSYDAGIHEALSILDESDKRAPEIEDPVLRASMRLHAATIRISTKGMRESMAATAAEYRRGRLGWFRVKFVPGSYGPSKAVAVKVERES